MSKVTVVGAGNVGATCANVIATREIADELVLLDIKEGVSEGKMLDIFQTGLRYEADRRDERLCRYGGFRRRGRDFGHAS